MPIDFLGTSFLENEYECEFASMSFLTSVGDLVMCKLM